MTFDKAQKQRVDKWLFFARVVKSRSLAAKLAAGGHVRVNGVKINQAAYGIKIDDVLTISLNQQIIIYKVLNGGERRGPAPEARLLYEDLSPPPPPKTVPRNAAKIQRDAGTGRPTKRDRRLTDKLRDQL